LNNNNTRSLVETSIITSLLVVFYALVIYVPFFSYLSFILPLFYAVVGIRNGEKNFYIMSIVSSIIVFLFSGIIGFIFLIGFGPIVGYVLYKFIQKKSKKSILILALTLTYLICFIGQIYLTNAFLNIDIFKSFSFEIENFKITMDTTFETLKTSGIYEENYLDTMKNNYISLADNFLVFLKLLFPFILIVLSFFNALFTAIFSYIIMKKINIKTVESKKLMYFKYPSHLMTGSTLIVVLSFIVIKMKIVNSDIMAMNIFFLLMFVFSIQGLAVLFYFMDKRNIKGALKAVILIVLLFLNPMIFLAILGWMDALLNLRKFKSEV